MRLLIHPPIGDVTVEGILYALSDPVRAAIFAEMAVSDCSRNCSDLLKVIERDIPKSTLSQHFKILRDAGLIRSERQGVEMRNTSRRAEIDGRFPDLIGVILQAYDRQREGRRRAARARRRK
jgi:DNA-binding transcriptional ArsR family regulator